MALPARRAFEIRFPVVEGYVVSLPRNRVVCDVESMEWTTLDPAATPVAAFVQPQVGYKIGDPGAYGGFGFQEVDRQTYYDAVHPQTIAFQIALGVIRQLIHATGADARQRNHRGALFPQVLRIVSSTSEPGSASTAFIRARSACRLMRSASPGCSPPRSGRTTPGANRRCSRG